MLTSWIPMVSQLRYPWTRIRQVLSPCAEKQTAVDQLSRFLKLCWNLAQFPKVANGLIQSETPTFILGRAVSGGRLATDGLLKQLEGFLLCIHRNVRSVSGDGVPRFERACTVTVAIELEPIFAQLVRSRGQEFIDSIDEWLERNTRFESPSERYIELGRGSLLHRSWRTTRSKAEVQVIRLSRTNHLRMALNRKT